MVNISLSADEALVLFELVSRHNRLENPSLLFEDRAEQRALWNLEAILEKELVTTFDPNYRRLLVDARERLRDRPDDEDGGR